MTNAGPSIEVLEARAKAGDARAQYVLAAMLSGTGRGEEAEVWLRMAADKGEPDALYTLATRGFRTLAGLAASTGLLEQAAQGGSAAARRLLAVLQAGGWAQPADFAAAARSLLDLASQGDPAAQRDIAGILLFKDADCEQIDALLASCCAVDPVAAAVSLKRGARGRYVIDADGRVLLQRLHYPRTDMLQRRLKPAASPPPPLDWNAIARTLEKADDAPAQETVCDAPAISLARRAFAPEIAEYVIASAGRLLAPSTTVDPATGAARLDEYRTSFTATLGPVDLDLTLVLFNQLLADCAATPNSQGEFLSVLYYRTGQEYRPHHDWLPPGPDVERAGQRIVTALGYLNADYEGGETAFLAPGLNIKGEEGDVLVFRNVDAAGGPELRSRHAGLPVRAGEKWLASRWFRSRNYDF